MLIVVALACLLAAVAVGVVVCQLRKRGMDRWLLPYVRQRSRRRLPAPDEDVHVLLCFADHYEPKQGNAPLEVARARVERWVHDFPRQFSGFRDSDGRPPRYTFFYPYEEYEPEFLDALAGLCKAGFGEVEVHLHHDRDTAEGLRQKLRWFKDVLAERHGLLARDRITGAAGYAFIHGNWALCNARPDGRLCGVNNELEVLRETGCYADLTMPSAPHITQTCKINSIYYARDLPGRARSHDRGVDVGLGPPPANSLLLIQGPLVLTWDNRKWGLLPRLENGCLQGSQRPSIARLPDWLRARVQVPTRPDWFFVKLYAHGAPEESHETLLGEPMVRFHQDLARLARDNPHFHFHYVTARELYNLVMAAEAGWQGSVAAALDYQFVSNLATTVHCGPKTQNTALPT
jgi:hypothetical protein